MSAARQPARISSRYDLRNDSSQKDIPVEANLLKICLHYVSIENDKEREEAGDRDYDLKWEPHGTIHIDYLEPDLNSYFDGPDNLAKIRAVVHLLCFTNPEEESTAAQLVGSALTDIFCVERTDIISDQTLILPKVFWPTKADTTCGLKWRMRCIRP
ncbi:hypothetical protein C8J57DRAFT_1213568 [Mycena rebaudengoi]|nr:hypothetical protein C8J57DRAFT_1213568 [Mycena rebaudengoi]